MVITTNTFGANEIKLEETGYSVEEIVDAAVSIAKEARGNSEAYIALDVQKDIINILKSEKTIGLTVSTHNLLMPRKSVTAIIGLIPKNKEVKKKGCEVCKNYENCSFRKEGIVCES